MYFNVPLCVCLCAYACVCVCKAAGSGFSESLLIYVREQLLLSELITQKQTEKREGSVWLCVRSCVAWAADD